MGLLIDPDQQGGACRRLFRPLRRFRDLPGRSRISVPDADQAPEPMQLAEHFDQETTVIDVHLCVPHQRERGLNVSSDTRDFDTRYVVETAMLRDENSGANESLFRRPERTSA
jgi:hypothetical protein